MSKFYLLLAICFVLCFSCSRKVSSYSDLSDTDFLYLQDGKFYHRDKVFFPIMLNYVPCFRLLNREVVISPIREYEDPDHFETSTKQDAHRQIIAHLRLIKSQGFNAIRFAMDRMGKDAHGWYYQGEQNVYLNKYNRQIIKEIDFVIREAKKLNLRCMLLFRPPYDDEEMIDFCENIFAYFAENPTIFAYDLFNEPLYFDEKTDGSGVAIPRPKEEAIELVVKWKYLVDKHAPKQLLTIGFSEPIEVFEWDPSLLPVDFISFHTYNPLRVPNEIFWYAKYAKKPWMIGETALPADGDSISYERQALFYKQVLRRVRSCGGAGLGWWEFQDIPNTHFEASFPGLLNHQGVTVLSSGDSILGTVKPFAQFVKKGLSTVVSDDCPCLNNYYNMLGYSNYKIIGQLVDADNGEPIEGGVVRAWNADWSIGLNTFTRKNGVFTIYSNDSCVHFEMSAPGYSSAKFDKSITYSWKNGKKQALENVKLEYQKIAYSPFLKFPQSSVFTFKGSFKAFKKSGRMPRVKLRRLAGY